MTRGSRQNSHPRGRLAEMRTQLSRTSGPWPARRANSERKVKETKAEEKQRSFRWFCGLLARSGTGGGAAAKTRRRRLDVCGDMDQRRGKGRR